MNFDAQYFRQVELLLKILPLLKQQKCFALEGGTAINMFVRDLPRLSVDIDLAYLPIEGRETFLKNITAELEWLCANIQRELPHHQVRKQYTNKSRQLFKLLVSNDEASVKIEPNLVLRGSVYPPEDVELCATAQDIFLTSCRVSSLSFADLYAGKMCAALSRQHPRDLFDIKILLESEGISDALRKAFVVYLASSPRPISELLQPNRLDLEDVFFKEFAGMVGSEKISYGELVHYRDRLIGEVQRALTESEREFLLSVKEGNADWSLMPHLDIQNLPALQWKMINVRRMGKEKRVRMLSQLKTILEL